MISGCRWSMAGGQWPSHREQSEAARNLLSKLIGHECVVEHDANGAPYLKGHPELNVSISHCRTAVAVAVSERKHVGIDIESRRKVSTGLMERVCSPDELSSIHSSVDPTMTFLQLWTRKEAILKMRGTGIRGFESMVNASTADDCTVEELECGLADTVASLATSL